MYVMLLPVKYLPEKSVTLTPSGMYIEDSSFSRTLQPFSTHISESLAHSLSSPNEDHSPTPNLALQWRSWFGLPQEAPSTTRFSNCSSHVSGV